MYFAGILIRGTLRFPFRRICERRVWLMPG